MTLHAKYHKTRRFLFRIGLGAIAIILAAVGCSRQGTGREAFLMSSYLDLRNYAHDHNGWFPQSEKGATAALQKLYPEFSSGIELAGLSGSVKSVTNALGNGQPLTEQITSWVYVQGLKDTDDGNIAILWESKPGLNFNGGKDPNGGHAVVLLDGSQRQIPLSEWREFEMKQRMLRDAALAKRTNAP